jgi:very-short-patch-repair endonuclease
VAGFFIDIAVKDPGNPGQYLMGIECDGASYHSMKSTRDRDRLRQNILEQKGWCIRRIWSTDWYKNPEVVIQPIIQELKEMMS